jgi:hypothetical protein
MAKQTFTVGQVLKAADLTNLQATAMGGGSPNQKTASYVLVAADAGTCIQMNSASSTTITVNQSLFSAGDSVQIQNIGSGTTTITAGTATVNTAGSAAVSQFDGGFLYFTSTSSAIWFNYTQSGLTNPLTTTGDMIYSSGGTTAARLAIGSTGQTLVVSGGIPAWATASSYNPNYTLINSGGTSLSGTSTQIASISGKTDLFIFVTGFSNTSTAGNFVLTINNDTSSLYNWYGLKYQSNGVPMRTTGTATSNQEVLIDQASSTTAYNAAIRITGCNSSGLKLIQVSAAQTNSSDNANAFITLGYYSGSSTVSSIEFKSTSSNFDAGTIFVYGA